MVRFGQHPSAKIAFHTWAGSIDSNVDLGASRHSYVPSLGGLTCDAWTATPFSGPLALRFHQFHRLPLMEIKLD